MIKLKKKKVTTVYITERLLTFYDALSKKSGGENLIGAPLLHTWSHSSREQ